LCIFLCLHCVSCIFVYVFCVALRSMEVIKIIYGEKKAF